MGCMVIEQGPRVHRALHPVLTEQPGCQTWRLLSPSKAPHYPMDQVHAFEAFCHPPSHLTTPPSHHSPPSLTSSRAQLISASGEHHSRIFPVLNLLPCSASLLCTSPLSTCFQFLIRSPRCLAWPPRLNCGLLVSVHFSLISLVIMEISYEVPLDKL